MQGSATSGRRILLGAAGAVLLMLPVVSGAEVYKFIDANGVVNFTNIEPPSNVDYSTFRFPCYASDPNCQRVKWDKVPLNTRAFDHEIRTAARHNQVDPSLVRAVIHAESAYQEDAVSPKGAQGLMQLMPGTAKELAVSDPFDPALNIEGGTRYLSKLLQEFNGSVALATAAYNAGPGAVRKYGGVPPYDETQEYVKRVRILYRRYKESI